MVEAFPHHIAKGSSTLRELYGVWMYFPTFATLMRAGNFLLGLDNICCVFIQHAPAWPHAGPTYSRRRQSRRRRLLRSFNVILGPCRCPRAGPSSGAGPSESSLGYAGRGQLCGTGGVSPARSPRFSGKGPVNRWTPAPAAPRYLRPNSTVTRAAWAAGRSSAIHSHSGPES